MSRGTKKLSLFWLDEDVNNDENQRIRNELQAIVDHLQTFTDLSTCQQCIQSLAQDKQRVLIVSGRLGLKMVPQIHHLQQVPAIYVYCMNRESNEQWALQYPKVKDVINKRQALLERIRLDKTSCREMEKRMSFNIYSTTAKRDQSTRDLRKQFTYSLALVKLLSRLNIPPSYEEPILALWKNESQDSTEDRRSFRVLTDKYTTNRALWCYTREWFPYDMLHDALANSNINRLLPYSFIIKDIHKELRQIPSQPSDSVYCYHLMTYNEMKYLEKSVNGIMLVKTFLRTNSNPEHAEQSLDTREANKFNYKVLFIINVRSHVAPTKPYGMIDKVSGLIEPGAMLFMPGSIFRLLQVTYVGKEDATVQMELCDENVGELQPAFQYMRRIHVDADNEITLYELANILAQMGKYDTAEQIYEFLVKETSPSASASVDLYCACASMSKIKQEYGNCVRWYEKALKRQTRADPNHLIKIGKLHGLIADAYVSDNEQEQALKQLKTAATIYLEGNLQNHLNLADIYKSMGIIYKRQENNVKALKYYQKAIDIDARSLTIRPNSAKTHSDMGMIYYNRQQHAKALEHYHKSLTIRRQIHTPPALPLAHALKNVGYIYFVMKNFQRALEFYQEAADMFRKLPPTNYDDLKIICEKIDQIRRETTDTDLFRSIVSF